MEVAASADNAACQEQAWTTVVALDQSEQSLHALGWALSAIRFGDSDKILLLHAKSSPIASAGPVYTLSNEAIICMELAQEREINAFMGKALDLCKEKQVIAEKHVVLGDARDIICEMVDKLHAKMLVIGSHGYGTFKRAVLGIVSDYCVHHVKCPVLLVKKPRKKPDEPKE